MKIVIGGASGLIGSALVKALRDRGDNVLRLVRREPRFPDEIRWEPSVEKLDLEAVRGADAIISLGGASVGKLPWTPSYRGILWASRIDTASTIVRALRALADAGEDVPMFISASASGYYGSQPGESLSEDSPPGTTFLARLCQAWEKTALRSADTTQTALIRTSPILHPDGVLKPMIRLTKLGLGGPLGSGEQIWPWISLDDEVRGIIHVLDKQLSGPINFTGPTSASMARIGRALAEELNKPFLVPAPEWPMKAILSPDAVESLLTADADITPDRLLESGFVFQHAAPEDAIRDSING